MAQITTVTALGLRPSQSSQQVTKTNTVERTTQSEISETVDLTDSRTPRPYQHMDPQTPLEHSLAHKKLSHNAFKHTGDRSQKKDQNPSFEKETEEVT